MKRIVLISSLITVFSCAMAQSYPATLNVAQPAKAISSGKMTLTSPDFKPFGKLGNNQVNHGFGCAGKNQSPALSWKNVPAQTKSLVLTVYDPDAPTGSGFWHWNVMNIPITVTGLAAGAGSEGGTLPEGAIQLNNDAGTVGFTGACPPAGDKPHRYIFTLYALSEKLDLPATVSPAIVGFTLNGKVLAKTQLIATYRR